MKLLFVKGSPRGVAGQSTKVAEAYLAGYRSKNPRATIEEIDLWHIPLPDFDGDRAAAKLSFFGITCVHCRRQADAIIRCTMQV